ncbi:MAG: DUF960 family protein [Anaerobutyricum soehngenii]
MRHFSEHPEYCQNYVIDLKNLVNQKIYVIDDSNHATMLLSEEY